MKRAKIDLSVYFLVVEANCFKKSHLDTDVVVLHGSNIFCIE